MVCFDSSLTPTTYIIHRGMKLVFLPPYSPDFNPIELAFSSIKAYIRRNRDELGDDPSLLDTNRFLIDAVFSVTPENASSYFQHCGYL